MGIQGSEKEGYTYNEEQIKLIDVYSKFEDTLDKLERFAELQNTEFNYEEDCQEMQKNKLICAIIPIVMVIRIFNNI